MKNKIIAIISLFCVSLTYAQVAIGKASVSSPAVSLEFGSENKGLILPWALGVEASDDYFTYFFNGTPGDPMTQQPIIPGTIVYDALRYKVRFYKGDTNTWFDLTPTIATVPPAEVVSYRTSTEVNDGRVFLSPGKVIISYNQAINTSTVPEGVLVLADVDKAMVLPLVENPHLNIINPSAGMVVFDSLSKNLMFYNGEKWSFWKP